MRALPVLLVSTALIGTACSADGPAADGPTPTSAPTAPSTSTGSSGAITEPIGGGGARFVQGLVRFDDCDALLDHVRAEARLRVGPYGLDGSGQIWQGGLAVEEPAEESAEEPADGPVPVSASDDADSGSGGGFTGTNVQVAGVDEPDIVKTDGRRIITVSENVLSHVDISSGTPVLTDQIHLPTGWGHELFFRGDRALLFTNAGTWGSPMPVDLVDDGDAEAEFATGTLPVGDAVAPEAQGPAAEITEIDLSDPHDLSIVASLQIEGRYLSARAIDDHVRVAVTSSPTQLPWLYPGSPAGEERAEAANRQIVDESTLDDWIPGYRLSGPGGTMSAPLLDCTSLHRPAEFAGFEVVSVIDLDLDDGLDAVATSTEAVGVLAAGSTVASSHDRFYVATTTWAPPPSGDASVDDDRIGQWEESYVTEIHAFAIAPGEPTAYVASGSVPGSLLNQFSLDEHDGHLRVVHTDGFPWNAADLSETILTVLHEDGDRLTPVGSVGGLGRGEQLYSARLMGDVGFAVTFRQIDPFYVLDLSDPANPRVAGELKIPGFSTYLHPVGEDLVLGVGQDALDTGQVTGFKLSLFDVSDPSAPREVSVWTMPGASSVAEHDHRAFQIQGTTAIVPLQSWQEDFDGAILFDVGGEISEVGRISHTPPEAPASDCRVIAPDELTPEASDLFWVARDGRLQVCEPGDVRGWTRGYCETIPIDAIDGWFWDEDARERDLAVLALQPDDVIELCWPDGGWQQVIHRSLVADGTLYTLSPTVLQANDLGTLDLVGQVPLR